MEMSQQMGVAGGGIGWERVVMVRKRDAPCCSTLLVGSSDDSQKPRREVSCVLFR